MIRAETLSIGHVYFDFGYESDDDSRPIISSYEYLGKEKGDARSADEPNQFIFRFIDTKDYLQLDESQIEHTILDVSGLVDALQLWSENNPGQTRNGD